MTIELDIFSGRPNPVWTLSPEESVALTEMLMNLPTSQAPAAEGGLGYRGFLLSNPERVAGLSARIRVYRGMVTIEEDGTPRSYLDTQGVERMLIRQASQRGYGAVWKDLLPPENGRF